MEGIVIKNTGSWYDVLSDGDGKVYSCKVRGNFRLKGIKTTNPVAIGDKVIFKLVDGEKVAVITALGERKNCIIRKSVNLSKRTHLIACNIDLGFLVISLNKPRTPQGFIDRFLLSCEAYNVDCCIVFNKIDLYTPKNLEELKEYISIYTKIGYECLVTSALTGDGMEGLKSKMQGKICLFSGNSGVGKSALINYVEPGLNIRIGEISEAHSKGKHTTTFAQMYPLSFGGYIMDTPGIKEFGMVKLNTEEISRYFPEMKDLLQNCKFNNCTHTHEPHCAVIEAVENGEISYIRYKSYINILSGDEVEIPGLLENKKDSKK